VPNTPAGKTLFTGAKDPTFCGEELLTTDGFFTPPNKVLTKSAISTIASIFYVWIFWLERIAAF
jgi:hypothetical protein